MAQGEKFVINCTKTIPLPDPGRDVLPVPPDDAERSGAKIDHSKWDALLRKHVLPTEIDGIVTNGVDYAGLAAETTLEEYLASLAIIETPTELQPNEKLALYLNAYNALCINLIVQAYKREGRLPKSINDLSKGKGADGSELGAVWDQDAGQVAGKMLSLNDIEHNILRTEWRDPRIHACIVCASASCPDLRPEAFAPQQLNRQMDDSVKAWLANSRKGVGEKGGHPIASRIFLWFREDFEAVSSTSSVIAWIASKYAAPTSADNASEGAGAVARVVARGASLEYFIYNWSLNAVNNGGGGGGGGGAEASSAGQLDVAPIKEAGSRVGSGSERGATRRASSKML